MYIILTHNSFLVNKNVPFIIQFCEFNEQEFYEEQLKKSVNDKTILIYIIYDDIYMHIFIIYDIKY